MDNLTKLYQDWKSKNTNADEYQAFQGGLTAGAVK